MQPWQLYFDIAGTGKLCYADTEFNENGTTKTVDLQHIKCNLNSFKPSFQAEREIKPHRSRNPTKLRGVAGQNE